MDPDVDLVELAKKTKNFSGAELEGLVRAAQSSAMNRLVKVIFQFIDWLFSIAYYLNLSICSSEILKILKFIVLGKIESFGIC